MPKRVCRSNSAVSRKSESGKLLDPTAESQAVGEKELDSSAKPKILKNTVAKCPEIVITIEGVSVNCLTDTGSEVTTITESFSRIFC